jgi:hypothetical protein
MRPRHLIFLILTRFLKTRPGSGTEPRDAVTGPVPAKRDIKCVQTDVRLMPVPQGEVSAEVIESLIYF